LSARFLLPLLIVTRCRPSSCLLLDGVDLRPSSGLYHAAAGQLQSYDRRWTSPPHRRLPQHLSQPGATFRLPRQPLSLCYRLVGVVLFGVDRAAGATAVPNTFEYFFIWYEAVRRGGTRAGSAA
jgi:hypothetical protein